MRISSSANIGTACRKKLQCTNKENSQRSEFGNASKSGSDKILTNNASPIQPKRKPKRYAFKSEIHWMEEHAMRIDWKIQKVGKSCKLKWRGLMGPSTPISTSWCLNSEIVHDSVAIESGQLWSLKLPNLKLQEIETRKGGLRESSWGSPAPMIRPHGGV